MPFDKFFTFLHLFHMQKVLSVLVMVSVLSVTSVFAAETTDTTMPDMTATPVTTSLSPEPAMTTADTMTTAEVTTPELNAAPTVAASAGSSLGEYKSVACSTNPAFTTNSCNQCFEGGAVKVGESINGMFDNWANNTTSMLIAYKDEQKLPNMVSFGSTWSNSPTDLAKFWKNSADISWVSLGGSGGRLQTILNPGQKVKFYEAEFGANYKLEKSDKKDGELVGMLRFPIVARAIDGTTGAEGASTTHYECVSYKLSAPAVTPTPTPEPTPTPTTPPTQVATGPAETLILIIAAFFIAFGMMFSLRKRS